MTALALAPPSNHRNPNSVASPTAIFVSGETTPRGPLIDLAPCLKQASLNQSRRLEIILGLTRAQFLARRD